MIMIGTVSQIMDCTWGKVKDRKGGEGAKQDIIRLKLEVMGIEQEVTHTLFVEKAPEMSYEMLLLYGFDKSFSLKSIPLQVTEFSTPIEKLFSLFKPNDLEVEVSIYESPHGETYYNVKEIIGFFEKDLPSNESIIKYDAMFRGYTKTIKPKKEKTSKPPSVNYDEKIPEKESPF